MVCWGCFEWCVGDVLNGVLGMFCHSFYKAKNSCCNVCG